ncbi:MAG: hypothetical protein UY31_C0024G0003 [Candidatus Wolfebacteria bacterium GW2011_GWE1_48_7]|nr:MAG: hypothetical protein UX49_C0008G0002 [Candidatus Wolfebacteria bacterium GW2011_GWC2_46_275]KKU41999.1 MAG: hypothetical protein UX58_C0004G0058 [Candidatus Wolfebacteria bacterium GW2011_GWB2_46_69]KKU54465.1 MAG: hypothetical protein UX76_C0002G0058 [Candidatus Wolfebacteria bacterium GW2011_GWC1_47_103]KKU59792.1 MAG: hypothetical protein UX83_C0002G0079 [Candidatus Wolfebacteria bacterium GW2011_GWE2_47_12]KKU65785.1 MAG: hypothetical protein UX90_C0002G0161 [Candidatus Wolfebacteri
MEIMNIDNPRWDEFVSQLSGPDGCHFRKRADSDDATWSCDHFKERSLAKEILEKMGNVDIEATLKYFDENGGSCDCNIVFRVDLLAD